MSSVKVSVCIPVYNGADYIRECIDSVLAQSYTNFEVVIVDNQSTDTTVEIIKSYTDSRIKFFQNESNIGMIPNWNMVLTKAQGEYVKILPADDVIYPSILEKEVGILEQDKQKKIAVVTVKKHIIDEKSKVLLSRGFASRTLQISGTAAINKNVRSGGNIIGEGGSLLFRRELIHKVGPFNSELFYVLDLDQWYKLLLHGDLYYINETLCAFRVSASSGSTQAQTKQNDDLRRFNRLVYSKKEYKVSYYSYLVGLITAALLTVAKKILYKFIIKR